MSVRKVVPLTLGYEDLPLAYSLLGAPAGERIREPVPAVLLDTTDGWVLLDTGFNTELLTNPVLRERYHPRESSIQPSLPPGEDAPLEQGLARHGLTVADIAVVAVSHLHNDHCGGLHHFAGSDVPVHVQDAELTYGLSADDAVEYGIFRADFDNPGLQWVRAQGDAEIVPGVSAVLTAGHTPGHQSFVVDLEDGSGYVFAFDAADLQVNLDEERPVGGTVHVPAEDTLGPILRLKEIARRTGYRLVPGHDPEVWPALTAELA
ncbi:N-acyl homoserine lactonase family protein [Rhodococcus sp. X156]|uniref:N-acyl homoserine lactonase family protein n=1 Tax=Rhodococcus sp. X156 TaxID=2499145 RepID=UPI000FD7B261|nr:N-acyl homoserine lactonase family protein [Rhodococcus sp. X156]